MGRAGTIFTRRRGPRQPMWSGTDPRGRLVRLFENTWTYHIERNHAEMRANADLVGPTVEDPDRITKSDDEHPDREVYERWADVRGFARPRRLVLAVVVEWRPPKRGPLKRGRRRGDTFTGTIVTAYTSGGLRPGEITWQRPDPASDPRTETSE
jgi:hypothetical protein